MSRQTLDLVTALGVLLSGLAAGGLLSYDIYRREAARTTDSPSSVLAGSRARITLRHAGLGLTAVFVVMVAWRFIGLAG
jgi:hypothetical protein